MGEFFQARRLPRNYFTGFGVAQEGTDQDHDLVIQNGVCRSADDVHDCSVILSGNAYIKKGDAAFSEGNNGGMQESGSDFAASAQYALKLIRKNSDPSVFDFCCGTSNTSAPSGWTFMRLLDLFMTDAAANMYHWAAYMVSGGAIEHRFDSPLAAYTLANPGTSRVQLLCPTNFPHIPSMSGVTVGGGRIFGEVDIEDTTPVGNTYMWIRGNDDFNEAASTNNFDLEVTNTGKRYGVFNLPFSAILNYRLSQSTADHTVGVRVRGYTFNRIRAVQ